MSSVAPKIYVDLDDVLCETGRELSRLARRLHGRSVDFDEMTSFDLGLAFGLNPDELAAFMTSANAPDLLANLEPMEGAVEVLTEWHRLGYEVHVVTGRPPITARASKQWLERHDIPHSSIIFVDKYGRGDSSHGHIPLGSLSDIGFCFAVEDSPSFVRYLSERLGIFVAMLDRPWNRACSFESKIAPGVKRCFNWRDVMETFGLVLS
jgi:uncharacterized protein